MIQGCVGARRRRRPAVLYGTDAGNDLVVSVDELGPDGARRRASAMRGAVAALRLRVDGAHNLLNAAAAIGAAGLVGVSPRTLLPRLASFAGVHRRFEHRGTARGADFFDDYGHTPGRDGGHDRTARRDGLAG